MTTPSLRQKVTQISIGAFILTSAIMLLGFIAYSMTKHNLAGMEVERDLQKTASTQTDQLIPSFLLPEQKDGIGLLLQRFKEHEHLSRVAIINNENEIPKGFSECTLKDGSSSCLSNDGMETAFIYPIKESNVKFGYLFKSKKMNSSWADRDILQIVGIFTIMLFFLFLTVYIVVVRVLSKTVPLSLDKLVEWIEADLTDKKTHLSNLPFKELEDLRNKISEVMERHNRSRDQAIVGQVSSGIMHDIKTPLQSIVIALHLVDEQEKNSPKRQARLENLFLMCRNNLPIIGDIIETTLDGNRQILINKKSSNIRTTLEDSVQYTKEYSRLRKVAVEIDSPDEILIEHDSTQLVRVVNNLLKNGIEAASAYQQSAPKVKISVQEHDDSHIKLTVEDSGEGIQGSPEKIFRAFRTSKVRGTGLGLLITKKIVEAHNGIIYASNSSSLGGAKMEVLLPRV